VGKGEPLMLDPEEGFRRFTPRARAVVMESMEAARVAGNTFIGSVHILLGLLTEPEALAGKAIVDQGVPLDRVREAATSALPTGGEPVEGLIPYDAHNYIGTEHILLALLEQENGSGLLAGLGIGKEATEEEIVTFLGEARKGRG
jgi:ATP-dependent Clp protease ATP-binding subunit ClpA